MPPERVCTSPFGNYFRVFRKRAVPSTERSFLSTGMTALCTGFGPFLWKRWVRGTRASGPPERVTARTLEMGEGPL